MKRTSVVSKSGLCGMAYDPGTETLELEFTSRKPDAPNPVYHYSKFTQKDWDAFQAAESKGSHFLRIIKPTFSCKKLEPPKEEGTNEAQAQEETPAKGKKSAKGTAD